MLSHNTHRLIAIIVVFVGMITTVIGVTLFKTQQSGSVLNEEIDIYADVGACILTFIVEPGSRAAMNWSTDIDVDVYDNTDTFLGTFSGTTNNDGELTLNICNEGIYAYQSGTYTFIVDGPSHIPTTFSGYWPATAAQTVDLTEGGQTIVPGDINQPSNDDEINSLDIARIIQNHGLNSGDAGYTYLDDLDLDDDVDTTDANIMFSNFYRSSDHSDSVNVALSCP